MPYRQISNEIVKGAAKEIKESLAHLPELKAEELKYLARCVELLREQTQTSCETKMKSFV